MVEAKESVPDNESRCPHEDEWHCRLLDKPCHPGIPGCILLGQPLIDAMLAYRQKQNKEQKKSGPS